MSEVGLSKISYLLGKQQKNEEILPKKENSISTLSSPSSLVSPDQLLSSLPNRQKNVIQRLNVFSSQESGFSDGNKIINSSSRVLHIGDSHTVGVYGKEIDKIMRSTGAKVFTLGSSGSAPASWVNGYVTKSGFAYMDEFGNNKVPSNLQIITEETAKKLREGKIKEWQIPTKTPNLNTLIKDFQPNVIVFSLGANLLRANGTTIENQVREVCEIAKASGAKIVWVGPPDGRPDKKPEAEQNRLYSHIQKIASQYGVFIDSRPYTDYPPGSGGDGVHYWGKQEKVAREWANKAFLEINR